MHREGHIGIGLLLYAPFTYAFFELELQTGWGLGIVGMAFWSFAPDFDLELPIRHRGPTHSILFAVIAGILTASIGVYFVYEGTFGGSTSLNYLMAIAFGFGIGFTGVIGHLIGDSFTKMGIRPLWPWSNRVMGLQRIYAANERINEGLWTAGAVAIVGAIVLASL